MMLHALLLNRSTAYADNSCQLRHIQCAAPSFDNCDKGFGAGQCTQISDGAANETCSMIVFPNGFSGSYKDRDVTCNEEDGCEAVNCPDECVNNPSVECQCVAEWGLDDSIHFEPAFCLNGSIDNSCHQQYFKCVAVDFNFCHQSYGTGLCTDPEPSGRNCTISYYPDGFNTTVDSSPVFCQNPAGCESIECTDNCHGFWHLNNQTDVSPGNCAANTGHLCQLKYLHCDDAQFDWCKEGYGKGSCQNPVSSENCTLTVFPAHHNDQCASPGGCEKLSCHSCKADWMVNNRTGITPEGCISGLDDGSCQLRFFQCSGLTLDFCQNGYGLGHCHNDHQQTDCTVWLVPAHQSFEDSDGNIQVCHEPSGCEWISCKNSCTGYGYQGYQETTPGNCAATVSSACKLQYFTCDAQKFDSCKGGYGVGTCSNADTVETCSIAVYPNGYKKTSDDPVLCSHKEGCEKIWCPKGCDENYCDCAGQWQVYGKTNVHPSGCLSSDSEDNSELALGLGVPAGIVLAATTVGAIVLLLICGQRYSKHGTYQTINSP